MVTTIQISEELKDLLKQRKLNPHETYEDIIWDLIEDTLELNEETLLAISEAEKEFRKGKSLSLDELKKELDL
jgi:predicted DNA-binding protein